MSAKIKFLKDRVGDTIYPVTKLNAIYSDDGVNIEDELLNLNGKVNNQLFAKYFNIEYTNFHNSNLKLGRYNIYSDTMLNPPMSGMLSGMVEVLATAQYIWVEYRPWNSVDIHTCNYNNSNGVWTSWVKVLNSNDIINSDTINDPNKVPSSAITYALGQKMSNNLNINPSISDITIDTNEYFEVLSANRNRVIKHKDYADLYLQLRVKTTLTSGTQYQINCSNLTDAKNHYGGTGFFHTQGMAGLWVAPGIILIQPFVNVPTDTEFNSQLSYLRN